MNYLKLEDYLSPGILPKDEENIEQEQEMENKYANILVCLDAGHASSTKGKRSPYSGYGSEPQLPLLEYEWNRVVVSRIEASLLSKGFKVFIVTPEVDEDVKLTTRYRRANGAKENNPDCKSLFISVHANAFGDGKSWNSANGWSCYTTKGQNNSDSFANCMYEAADEILKPMGMSIRKDMKDGDPDYEENFTVIYGANMPAVLTENMFYTNIKDTEFMSSDEGIDAIVGIHVNGVIKYVDRYLR